MIYNQLKMLCTQHGTTPTAFVSEVLHLSTSKVTAWKNGSIPKSETLIAIANYFGVTIGFLFDGIDNKTSSTLSPSEQRCLKAFNRLTHDDKVDFIARMEQRYEDYSVNVIQTAARSKEGSKAIDATDIKNLTNADVQEY